MPRGFETLPRVPFLTTPTAVDELPRLREALAPAPRILIKRDDVIPFAFGGNKVRKLEYVAAAAVADGADRLVTSGGLQSNHARATAAAASYLGLKAVLVLNGEPRARSAARRCSTTCLAPKSITLLNAPIECPASAHRRRAA